MKISSNFEVNLSYDKQNIKIYLNLTNIYKTQIVSVTYMNKDFVECFMILTVF